ncbi:PH domain leucine-rich repeat-containing protein phosphatase 2-like [Haliotis cracherodii]|uniref:PH domain leucine-rich repeat-containing protein phosphatase 2-like n=1 Tax=Haliotis cracherodii TaxID=6455 RepID=UPI0039EB1D0F
MSVKSYSGWSDHSNGTHSAAGSHSYLHNDTYSNKYQGSNAWWSVGEFLKPGLTHQSVGLTLSNNSNDDETWDLSDSLADLYMEVSQREHEASERLGGGRDRREHRKVDIQAWLEKDTSHGCIRVFNSDSEENSRLFPCTISTTAQKICMQIGIPSNSLHIQQNGDIIRRLEPFDCPLAIQNEYLSSLGLTDIKRVQEEGPDDDLCYLVKFYAGKPISDSTYSRSQLSSYAYLRKGKLLHQWVRRLCVITGTRLLIYRDRNAKPTVVQLAKGSVEEVQVKGQEHCLKLTSTIQGERSIYISFMNAGEYNKWIKKAKKATSKLPTKADLSNCHLEFLPETVFINDDLEILILRHNVLRERPIEEDIYTIGWLDDLPRFTHLRSLNLADNGLVNFPQAVCRMRTLTELNVASNKLEEIPSQISDLANLQALHLHNNRLSSLPEEIAQMKRLVVIVLAFNRFTFIPSVLCQSQHASYKLDSLIMAGNQISRLPTDYLDHMTHIKKIDLRMNKLQLLPTETARFQSLDHVTHLDIRDNEIIDLDIRAIRALEYLNCERNMIRSLQINGTSLKNIFVSHNKIESISINPKPEWLVSMDVSYNQLKEVPTWLGDCFFLVRLDLSHNNIARLPDRMLTDARKLKILRVNHNQLKLLPTDIKHCLIEELHLERNLLTQLPPELFIRANKLRCLNLTGNCLVDLPAPNRNDTYNKLQELYLTSNRLTNKAIFKVCCFPRLRVLHLAKNCITEIKDSEFQKLEQLQELNVSFNSLRFLPVCLSRHTKLQVLRANANLLQELPNFRNSSSLKVLEVGTNCLENVSMGNLMTSKVNLLDISGNPNIFVNTDELQGIKNAKRVCMIDMRGQNRSLNNVSAVEAELSWQSGFSQTSGMRNKLSVAMLNKSKFSEAGDALFGIFDGGRNDEVAKLMIELTPAIVAEEKEKMPTQEGFLKYTMLSAHKKIKSVGQRVGAAAALVHIQKHPNHHDQYSLCVASVGDTEVVLCRQNSPVCLTRQFTVSHDKGECQRVINSDGIITEDGRISGVTFNTRLIGCSYLFPQVIPSPHITSTTLTSEDQMIIIANQGLWRYMSHQEAVREINDIPDPVIAAKRLQDLAQGYGSRENIGILVVKLLLSDAEKFRMSEILRTQMQGQKQLLNKLREQANVTQLHAIPAVSELGGIVIDKAGRVKKHRGERPSLSVKPTPAPNNRYRKKDANPNWETVLQKRLADEVKDKEMQEMFKITEEEDNQEELEEPRSNWSTLTKKRETASESAAMNQKQMAQRNPIPSANTSAVKPMVRTESTDTITSLDEFYRQPIVTANIDRDAILFHQMQMARAQSISSSSLDSTQSDPMYASVREVYRGPRAPSRSIEVLVHTPTSDEQRFQPVRVHRRPEKAVAPLQLDPKTEKSGKAEDDIDAIESEIIESFHASIEDLYARVMKKKQSIMEKDPSKVNLVKFNGSDDTLVGDYEEVYVQQSHPHGPGYQEAVTVIDDLTDLDDTIDAAEDENGVGSHQDQGARKHSPTPAGVTRFPSQQSVIITYL